MASLHYGSLFNPTSSRRFSSVMDRSSPLAAGAQASQLLRICNLDKNNTMRFQQSHYNNHMDQSFYERFTLRQLHKEKFVSNASSANIYQSEENHVLRIRIETTINFMGVMYRFIRPYAAIGTCFNVLSMSFLAVEKLSDFSPLFFMRMLPALVGGIFMQMYVCGFNQICDIELDKVNKPFLPLAAGELSVKAAVIISSLSAIMSLSIAWIAGSVSLFWGFIGWFLAGTAYSANVLPLLRWKRFPFTAALYMLIARAMVVPMGYYMHMQNSIHGTSVLLSRPTIFAVGMLSMFSIAMIFFKDIPDMKGDQMHGIKSLALRLGEKQMFWTCIWFLEIAYVAAIFVGATSSIPWSKYVTIMGHVAMASILWIRAKSVDLKSTVAIESMYKFFWQLLFAEYCLIPLVR